MKLPALQNTKKLAGFGVSAGEDFAPEMRNSRNVVVPCMKCEEKTQNLPEER
jgi:hypothetical protein